MKIISNLVKIIVIFVCFAIPFLSYNGIVYPAEWYTDDGMEYLTNRDYQTVAQRALCNKVFPHNLNKQKVCFIENALAYRIIMDYLENSAGNLEGDNMKIKSCIAVALDKYWVSGIDSCAWGLVADTVLECVEE
jgi:hypothetical protein